MTSLYSGPIYSVAVSDDTGVAMAAATVHDVIAIQAPIDTGTGRTDQDASDLRIREIRLGQYSDPPAAGAEEILGVRVLRYVNCDTGVSFLDTGTNNKRVHAYPLNSRFGFDTGGAKAIRAVAMADTGGIEGVGGRPVSHVVDTGYTASAWKNTTKRPNGTARRETIIADTWNIAAPWVYYPPEEECPILRSGDVLTVRLSKPADVITLNGTVIVEKIGVPGKR